MTLKKKLLIASACVSAAGLIVLLILGIYIKFDLRRLNNVAYEEKTYTLDENFSSVYIDTCDCDVKFVRSDAFSFNVTWINQNEGDTCAVEGGVLKIVSTAKKTHGSLFSPVFDFKDGEPDIVITIPNRTVDSLTIKTSGGQVEISDYFNITPGNVTLESDGGTIIYSAGASDSITADCKSGKIELSNSKCSTITLTLESGVMVLNDVETESNIDATVKSGTFTVNNATCYDFNASSESGEMDINGVNSGNVLYIKNGSADVDVEDSDANVVKIDNDSGSVKAEFLTDKIFTTKSTDGGKIKIPDPRDDLAGKCVINTKSGDVKCSIAG